VVAFYDLRPGNSEPILTAVELVYGACKVEQQCGFTLVIQLKDIY